MTEILHNNYYSSCTVCFKVKLARTCHGKNTSVINTFIIFCETINYGKYCTITVTCKI